MPAKSVAQQQASAIAEHEPRKLYARNRGLLSMDKSELSKFASTKHRGLPKRKQKKRSMKSRRK